MTTFDLSPAFIKLFYNRSGISKPHVKVIPTKPSGSVVSGSEPNVLGHDSSALAFSLAIAAYVAVAKTIYANTMTFTHAEFWSKPSPSSDPLFIFDVSLGVQGTSTDPMLIAGQAVFTFRSSAGGLYRDYWMEPSAPVNIVAFRPHATNFENVSELNTADGSFVYARDNGKPVAEISLKTKVNDVLRRKYLTG